MKEEVQKVRRVNHQAIILILMFIIGIGVMILLQTNKSSFDLAGKPRFKKGVSAPNFTLPDLGGKIVSLADYRGQVVLLNIWATWCAPCVVEMPSMEKLHQELKDEKFVILAVSIDETGADVVLPFMKKNKLSFPALIDSAGTLKNLYRTTGVPESFIIDKQGRILEEIIGPRDWAAPGALKYFRSLIQENS
ncbi:MAG: TlpA family protein disulfide reductase [bacterium]|nr:TlpA family protein disulfide reductase [bacterium]